MAEIFLVSREAVSPNRALFHRVIVVLNHTVLPAEA